ncbi:helix-turn-helix transcriptional regulator [Clostridium sp. PL3]|uniref:Helix-turn-helix transcriptional regulator n=1 Tax=Clostridium thailandense TaxID=2794346 RepID=A0A949X2I7_9CLOT|nr:AraC family transcriptional regulator [Clostridium thailandense]MBV7271413.1 helix-turn-helix transcriptional regulator [Clostridium thailandense]
MSQVDRHKNRIVYIEFIADESFSNLPYKERFTIIFVTSGSMNLQLNDYPIKVVAPSILCLSMEDTIQVSEKQNISAQSDSLWVCRIKKYLIQILGLLEEINHHIEQSPVGLVLEYMYTNYSDKISLEDLTRCAHLNRVSLNKMFQDLCGCTAMGYLLSYRLKVAENLLTHTGMSLNEIARAAGFEYDTYFIKQFTVKRGMTPTEFRNTSREFAYCQ